MISSVRWGMAKCYRKGDQCHLTSQKALERIQL